MDERGDLRERVIVVTSEAHLPAVLRDHRPSHAACFGSPSRAPAEADVPHTLAQTFHDIAAPRAGHRAPSRRDVTALVAFARAWDGAAPMVLQCWMGVSRSTAAALVVGASLGADPVALARALRAASPSATPNPLMLAHGDDVLDLGGTLAAGGRAIGRGTVPVAQPFVLRLARPFAMQLEHPFALRPAP